jgi:Uma2 family endonuclease
MATATEARPWTAVDLAERFGPIPLYRIVTSPPPGLATVEDAVELNDRYKRPCELVDGVLVEKDMGAYESMLAAEIIRALKNFVKPRRLGTVLGEAGLLELIPGVIRIPDVSFLSIEKFPGGRFPGESAPSLAPDIAIEVLSKGNTAKEMAEKLRDYFAAGARLVWYVDPQKRQVEVFTSPEQRRVVHEHETLDGGDVLPGFEMSLRELFTELPRQ